MSGMDSSISPGPRAIVSMPSVTCKNGKTPFGQFRGDSNAIANKNSLCDRSSTNINGNTTTATVDITPSNVLQGIASTATPASLQGPPPRQDINDTRHLNNRLHIMSDINPNVSSSVCHHRIIVFTYPRLSYYDVQNHYLHNSLDTGFRNTRGTVFFIAFFVSQNMISKDSVSHEIADCVLRYPALVLRKCYARVI